MALVVLCVALGDLARMNERVGRMRNEFPATHHPFWRWTVRRHIRTTDDVDLAPEEMPTQLQQVYQALRVIGVQMGQKDSIDLIRHETQLRKLPRRASTGIELQQQIGTAALS
jgi:hypothetical protein